MKLLQNCNLLEGECAIFDDVISQILKSIKAFFALIKNSSYKVKQGIFSVLAIVAIFASLSFTGARIAYKVNYSGNVIATVSSKNQFDEAVRIVIDIVGGDDVENVVDKPQFNATVALDKDINNTTEIADAIINNTNEIVKASTLFIDGNATVCAEKSVIDDAINSRLNEFNTENDDCTSSFINTVTFEEGYFTASELDGKNEVENAVNTLDVVTQIRQTTDVIVPYNSTVQKTNEQLLGYSEVTVAGVSGVTRITQDTVLLNGQVQSVTDVDSQVVVAPVDEIIVKGTAKTLASAQQKQAAHSAGFIFPVPAGSWKVSSYYGDGRNHKGVDICAKSGTSIYAVADGRVVFSGWNGDYGNCVIIEHENGMRTLYAHAKQLCCSVGDTVSQGEIIALVGTTGQSVGNHVHFEVKINGKNVDPAPYIGLD